MIHRNGLANEIASTRNGFETVLRKERFVVLAPPTRRFLASSRKPPFVSLLCCSSMFLPSDHLRAKRLEKSMRLVTAISPPRLFPGRWCACKKRGLLIYRPQITRGRRKKALDFYWPQLLLIHHSVGRPASSWIERPPRLIASCTPCEFNFPSPILHGLAIILPFHEN